MAKKEEVKLRGGVCRLRRERRARVSKERTNEKRERKGVLSLENGRVFEACWFFWKRANEGGTVLDLPGETQNLPARRVCLFGGSGRGGLHVESAIDSYEEVILP